MARTCPVCQGTGTMIENPCAKCKGQRVLTRTHTLQVKVPPGVEDGTRILYTGHGDAGVDGGPAGDVYVVLHVTEHPFFEREGKDLHCAIPISFTQAALGAKVKIPTLEGEATLEIPEGTQSGTSFRVRKKGMPVLNGSGRGDLFVEVKVATPEKLTRQQRELLEQLARDTGAGEQAAEKRPAEQNEGYVQLTSSPSGDQEARSFAPRSFFSVSARPSIVLKASAACFRLEA